MSTSALFLVSLALAATFGVHGAPFVTGGILMLSYEDTECTKPLTYATAPIMSRTRIASTSCMCEVVDLSNNRHPPDIHLQWFGIRVCYENCGSGTSPVVITRRVVEMFSKKVTLNNIPVTPMDCSGTSPGLPPARLVEGQWVGLWNSTIVDLKGFGSTGNYSYHPEAYWNWWTLGQTQDRPGTPGGSYVYDEISTPCIPGTSVMAHGTMNFGRKYSLAPNETLDAWENFMSPANEICNGGGDGDSGDDGDGDSGGNNGGTDNSVTSPSAGDSSAVVIIVVAAGAGGGVLLILLIAVVVVCISRQTKKGDGVVSGETTAELATA